MQFLVRWIESSSVEVTYIQYTNISYSTNFHTKLSALKMIKNKYVTLLNNIGLQLIIQKTFWVLKQGLELSFKNLIL